MKIGPTWWQMVTTDTEGVPFGGRYGDRLRFEARAAKIGIRVGWSRLRRCFGLYTMKGQRPVIQLMLTGGDGPVPFSDQLLSAVRGIRERFARQTNQTIGEWMKQRQRDTQYARRNELANDRPRIVRDLAREVVMRRGMISPRVFTGKGFERLRGRN